MNRLERNVTNDGVCTVIFSIEASEKQQIHYSLEYGRTWIEKGAECNEVWCSLKCNATQNIQYNTIVESGLSAYEHGLSGRNQIAVLKSSASMRSNVLERRMNVKENGNREFELGELSPTFF